MGYVFTICITYCLQHIKAHIWYSVQHANESCYIRIHMFECPEVCLTQIVVYRPKHSTYSTAFFSQIYPLGQGFGTSNWIIQELRPLDDLQMHGMEKIARIVRTMMKARFSYVMKSRRKIWVFSTSTSDAPQSLTPSVNFRGLKSLLQFKIRGKDALN